MKNILINDEQIMSTVDEACKLLKTDIDDYTLYGNKLNGKYITVQDVIDLIPVLVDEIKSLNRELDGLSAENEEMEIDIENLKDHLKFLTTPFGKDEYYDECQWED